MPLKDGINVPGSVPDLDSIGSRSEYLAFLFHSLRKLRTFHAESFGEVTTDKVSHPLIALTPKRVVRDAPWVLVSGGVHGDEPAGVVAAEKIVAEYDRHSPELNLAVIPCLNPTGIVAGKAESDFGDNLNRSFGPDITAYEAKQVRDWLISKHVRFEMTLDLHEINPVYSGEGFNPDDNPRDCYLYETQVDHSLRIGDRMMAAVRDQVEVCDWSEIYQDVAKDGVVYYPEACRNEVYAEETSFDSFLNVNWTNHSFTTETPTGWPLAKRVWTHLQWVKTACRAAMERSGRQPLPS